MCGRLVKDYDSCLSEHILKSCICISESNSAGEHGFALEFDFCTLLKC